MKVGVVIVCAGRGLRLKKGDKATLSLADKPLFYHAVNIFKNIKEVNQIALVLRKKNFALAKNLIDDRRVILVEGGPKRKDSVYNGLQVLNKNISHVLIHDGARPFTSQRLVYRLIATLTKNDAVIPVISSKDALKLIENDKVKNTLSREKIGCVQTPQGFKKSLLLKAYSSLGSKDAVDDAWAVELLGHEVKTIRGQINNIKITYPQDVQHAQMLIQSNGYRVGLGFDVHRFSLRKKKLILGGVVVPAPFGLEAVSDGDVVLHAIADGVCGAAGLGDIGDYFPPQNRKSKGIKSRKIVDTVLNDIKDKFAIENIDITIIAQKPKLKPYKKQMLAALKKIFHQIPINVKIKSKEGLDILGGLDSIACVAAILLRKNVKYI